MLVLTLYGEYPVFKLFGVKMRNQKQDKRFFTHAEKVTPSGTEVSGLYSTSMIPFLGEMVHS